MFWYLTIWGISYLLGFIVLWTIREADAIFWFHLFQLRIRSRFLRLLDIKPSKNYKVRNFFHNLQSEEEVDFSSMVPIPQIVGSYCIENLQSREFSLVSSKVRSIPVSNLAGIPQIVGFISCRQTYKVRNCSQRPANWGMSSDPMKLRFLRL